MSDVASYLLGATGSEKKVSNLTLKLTESSKWIGSETRLASGALVRDNVVKKRTWKLAWKWLPGRTTLVTDGGLGRDDLRALFDAGSAVNFILPKDGAAVETVSVLFGMAFNEELMQSRPIWKWNVSFELNEV